MEQLNNIIESNKWLKCLQALVKGDDDISPKQVRVTGIAKLELNLGLLKAKTALGAFVREVRDMYY